MSLFQVVQTLLDGKANVNISGIVGDRPLHLACSRGHVGIVKMLLSKEECDGMFKYTIMFRDRFNTAQLFSLKF